MRNEESVGGLVALAACIAMEQLFEVVSDQMGDFSIEVGFPGKSQMVELNNEMSAVEVAAKLKELVLAAFPKFAEQG